MSGLFRGLQTVSGVRIGGIRGLHQSGTLSGQKAVRFLKAQKKRQQNEVKQAKLENILDSVDPVMGRDQTPFITRVKAEVKGSKVLSHGHEIGEVEKLMAAVESTRKEQLKLSGVDEQLMEEESLEDLGARRESVLRILNIKNAENKDSTKMALKLAREEFQRFPGDTGSPEVQAACMTIRILNMAEHVKDNKKDFANTKVLRTLVQQRQSILRYLKRADAQKYYWTIQKLGLSDNAVVHEFNMDRKYMQDYQFFGDKVLVKESKRESDKKRRDLRKQKRFERTDSP